MMGWPRTKKVKATGGSELKEEYPASKNYLINRARLISALRKTLTLSSTRNYLYSSFELKFLSGRGVNYISFNDFLHFEKSMPVPPAEACAML